MQEKYAKSSHTIANVCLISPVNSCDAIITMRGMESQQEKQEIKGRRKTPEQSHSIESQTMRIIELLPTQCKCTKTEKSKNFPVKELPNLGSIKSIKLSTFDSLIDNIFFKIHSFFNLADSMLC